MSDPSENLRAAMSSFPGFSDFQGCLHEEFVMADGGGVLILESIKTLLDNEHQFAFSLALSAPPPLRPQASYRLRHPRLGVFDLFLVPVRSLPSGFEYEAVFNLLKPHSEARAVTEPQT